MTTRDRARASRATAIRKMFSAVRRTSPAPLKALLDAGADVNARNEDDVTALHMAVDAGQLEAVKLLVERGADVNAKGPRGLMPLFAKSTRSPYRAEPSRQLGRRGDERALILFLLQHGADPNGTYPTGDRVLHRAVASLDRELIADILRHRGDPNLAGEQGDRPLHIAADALDQETAVLLVDGGADVNARDDVGRNALHRVVQRLLMLEGSKSGTDARSRGMKLVRWLLDKGIDQTARGQGMTAAEMAVSYDLLPVLKELSLIDEDAVLRALRQRREEALALFEERGLGPTARGWRLGGA